MSTERDGERWREEREGRRERDTSSWKWGRIPGQGQRVQGQASVDEQKVSVELVWLRHHTSGGGNGDKVGKTGRGWTVGHEVHSMDLTPLARGALQVLKSEV